MHSRIDYFFMFKTDRCKIIKCDLGVKDISDHAGVYLTLKLNHEPRETLWRLNTGLLNDTKLKSFIKYEWKEYMINNNNGTVSPSTLWDASKAVMRGKLIMWSSQRKKERKKLRI